MRLMGRGGEKTSAAVSETAVSRNQRDLASLIEHGRLFPCMRALLTLQETSRPHFGR